MEYRLPAEDPPLLDWPAQLVDPDVGALAVDRYVTSGRRQRAARVSP